MNSYRQVVQVNWIIRSVVITEGGLSICCVYLLTSYNLSQTEQFCIYVDEMALPSYSLSTVSFRIYSVGSQLSHLSHTPVWLRHTISHTAIFSGTDPDYLPFQYMVLCPHRWRKYILPGSLYGLDFANDSGAKANCFSIWLFVDFEVSITRTVQPQDYCSSVCNQMQG